MTLTEAIIQLWLDEHWLACTPVPWVKGGTGGAFEPSLYSDTQDMVSSPSAYIPVTLYLGDDMHGKCGPSPG